jgi:hypothetical protein
MSEDGKGKGLKSALTGLLARVFRQNTKQAVVDPARPTTEWIDEDFKPATAATSAYHDPWAVESAQFDQTIPAPPPATEPSTHVGTTQTHAVDPQKRDSTVSESESAAAANTSWSNSNIVPSDTQVDEPGVPSRSNSNHSEEDLLATFDVFDPDASKPSTPIANGSLDVVAGTWDFDPLDPELPTYDPKRRESPWPTILFDRDEARRLRAKTLASEIAEEMYITTSKELFETELELQSLLLGKANHKTVDELKELAGSGLDLTTLRRVIQIRETWQNTPEWWYRRVGREFKFSSWGQGQMSWQLAYRIATTRHFSLSDNSVVSEWFQDWAEAPFHISNPKTFAKYIEERLDHLDEHAVASTWDERPQEGVKEEISDSIYWHKSEAAPVEGYVGSEIAILSGDPSRPSRMPR